MLNRSRSFPQPRSIILPYAVALVLLAVFLWTRNSNLYPQEFSDEYTYSRGARLQPLADAGIPNYLFFALFRTTSACGDAFLDCARHLNLLLFISASPFIYLTTRRVASPHIAGVATLLALAEPTNIYTAFFTPETSYWFVFWGTTWLTVRAGERRQWTGWAVVGIAVGVLALVKPHGLFVALALAAYAALDGAASSSGKRMVAVVLIVGCAVAIKLVGGLMFAGPAGLTLFGASYGGMASTGLDGPRIAGTVAASARIFGNHLCALILVFALPVGAAAVALVSRHGAADRPLRSLALLTFCLIVTLAAMAAIFTATVAGQGPYENEFRVHTRYYSFAFPLLLMLAASQVERLQVRTRVRFLVGAVLAAGVLVAMTVGLAGLDLHLIDGPEVFTAGAHSATRRIAGLFALLVIGAWCANPRAGALAFLLLLTPWFEWRGNREVLDLFDSHRTTTIFDRAGAAAQRIVPAGEQVLVAADEETGAFRAMFRLDRPHSSYEILKPGEIARITMVNEGQWLLVVPEHPVEGTAAITRAFDGFVLLRR